MKKLSWILLSVLLVLTISTIVYFEINGPEEWTYQTPYSSSITLTPISGFVPAPSSTENMTLISTPTPTSITPYPSNGSTNGGR